LAKAPVGIRSDPLPRAKGLAGESVWAYLVVSSLPQAPTLADQRAWAEGEAKSKGWKLTRVLDGVASGKAGPRSVMRKLLAELRALPEAARPAFVLLTRLDRVARGPIVETQLVVHDLHELGVRVWERDTGELRVETALEQLMVAIKATVAAQENEVRSDKRRAVVKRKREAGLPVSPQRPYGLQLDLVTKRDVPREPAAAAVREAFQMRLESIGYHAIGRRMFATAPPHEFKNGRVSKIRWSTTMVSRMLSNRAYIAAGVVDELTFERAQRIKLSRQAHWPPRPARHPWPLSGALRCWCGRAMTASTGGKNPRNRVRYYQCRNSAAHVDFKFRRARADDVETQFVELLERLAAHPGLVTRYRARVRSDSPAMIERAAKTVAKRLEELRRLREAAWSMHERGTIREENLRERFDALDAERDELEVAAARLASERILLAGAAAEVRDAEASVAKAATRYRRGSVEQRRQIAIAVAKALGGLCVEANGKLVPRAVHLATPSRAKRTTGATETAG